jgi:hypothetical protein
MENVDVLKRCSRRLAELEDDGDRSADAAAAGRAG